MKEDVKHLLKIRRVRADLKVGVKDLLRPLSLYKYMKYLAI